MFREYLNEYGDMILRAIITGVIGLVGVAVRNYLKNIADDSTRRKAVKTGVLAVEQLYKDLHGEEKFKKCCELVVEYLNEKGLTITELQLRMLIEAEVKQMNDWIVTELSEDEA